jgi:predicted ribosome quality control (RQC) complex YloA/Tae2 family protein
MEFEISNLALMHLIEENASLENGFINKTQTTEDGLLKLKIHTKEGDKTIIITKNAFFISDKSIPAKQNPGGFSALLKKYLFNQRIISIKQKGFDRIILFEFPESFLILELFAKGNIILCNKEKKIIKAMRKEKWKDRELAKEEIYTFPSSRGANPLEIKEKEFLEKLRENRKSFFGAILDILNVSPGILEYLFEIEKLDKKKDAKETSEAEGKKILKKIKEKYSSKKEKILLYNNVLYSIDIEKGEEFESLNKALNKLVYAEKPKEFVKKVKKKKENDYEKEIEKAKENIETFKKKGEEIYLKFNDLSYIIGKIKKLKKEGKREKEIIESVNSEKAKILKLDLEKDKVTLEL